MVGFSQPVNSQTPKRLDGQQVLNGDAAQIEQAQNRVLNEVVRAGSSGSDADGHGTLGQPAGCLLFPLGVVHAALGLTIAASLPDSLLHHMRVGIGYLMYHP